MAKRKRTIIKHPDIGLEVIIDKDPIFYNTNGEFLISFETQEISFSNGPFNEEQRDLLTSKVHAAQFYGSVLPIFKGDRLRLLAHQDENIQTCYHGMIDCWTIES